MNIALIVVTVFSLTLSAIMGVAVWRLAREERRRSAARVAALAMEIHGQPGAPRRFDDELELQPRPISSGHSDIFARAETGMSQGSRFAAVVALGLFVVGTGAALAVVLSSGSRAAANPAPAHAPVAPGSNQTLRANALPTQAAPIESFPLELVALGHERDADRFTIRGIVRNPPSAGEVSGLTAVVFLFNRDGGFIASGRAAIDASALAPGAESPFGVTVAGTADVSRYRVSFRTDGGAVPHVDRRETTLEVRRY